MAALFEQMTQNPEAAASLLQTLASLDGANQRNDEASASEESGPKFPPGMMGIDPLPGFVFKTKLAETKDNWKKGMKVFINVCYHEVIPPPPDASLDEIAKAAEEGNHAAYKMPLSLAGPTIDRDKTGTLCLVFEACISPSSVEKAKVDSGFLSWVAELCFEWLEEKHKIALEREFTLPKLKAKGKLSTHVVRQNIKPKIMEMPKKAAVVDHKEPVTEPVIPSIYAVSADLL
ncbi:pre-RNA processing PIH1/Nop17-domain-containing protein [Chytridium lagenaria]|nr:pre-RNA processing PIH1/Nop17-domain-containing protein [Chytridium lagenaria]